MKIQIATSLTVASVFLAFPAFAQSAPGANPELATLSIDLQNSRNSAVSIQAQAEEKRKLKVLAAKENEIAAEPVADQSEGASGGDYTVVIPTGNGLVPVRGSRIMPRAGSLEGSNETVGVPGTDRN